MAMSGFQKVFLCTLRLFLPFLACLLAACSGRPEKPVAPLFSLSDHPKQGQEHYDLSQIQRSGTLIGGTLSGPDTYYEYHGREMGLQFELAEDYAQSIGVRLRMEVYADTVTLLAKLSDGEIDFVALPMPQWLTRDDAPQLRASVAAWWQPERVERKRTSIRSRTFTVKRRMRPVMQDASRGIISAYDHLFRAHAATAVWDWRLLAAQCYQESGFDPKAVSSMGAQGLMQLMPATSAALGLAPESVFDPEQNIAAAVRYIGRTSGYFSDIAEPDERIRFTLAAYNGGVGHVQDAQTLARKHGGNPHRWQDVSAYILLLSQAQYYRDPDVRHGYMRGSETEAYVRLIMERWAQYCLGARAYAKGSTPSPSRRSMHNGTFRSRVKPAEELGK